MSVPEVSREVPRVPKPVPHEGKKVGRPRVNWTPEEIRERRRIYIRAYRARKKAEKEKKTEAETEKAEEQGDKGAGGRNN